MLDKMPQYAICIENTEYPVALEMHKVYRVLPDDDAAADGDCRIIDESGEDYLYLARYFVFISLPEDAEKVLKESYSSYSINN